MRFFTVIASETKKGLELQPDFSSYPTDDIMIRGGGFYADERIDRGEPIVSRKTYGSYISGVLTRFNKYVREMPDSYTQLDQNFVFLNQEVKPKDYASKRLPYDLEDGDMRRSRAVAQDPSSSRMLRLEASPVRSRGWGYYVLGSALERLIRAHRAGKDRMGDRFTSSRRLEEDPEILRIIR